jgi:hypothetical protein
MISRQKIYLAVAGATRSHNRASHETEPKNPCVAVIRRRDTGCVERRNGSRHKD